MSYYTEQTHKKISTFIPNNFEELLAEISNMTLNCKCAKLKEKEDDRCKVLINPKEYFCDGINLNQIKSIAVRKGNDNGDKCQIFIEDCISYSQVITLNIKQTFFLFMSILED